MAAKYEAVASVRILKCFLTSEDISEFGEFLSFLKVDLSTVTFQPEQHESSQFAPMQENVDMYLNVFADWLAIDALSINLSKFRS
jgi:hypothetical protein